MTMTTNTAEDLPSENSNIKPVEMNMPLKDKYMAVYSFDKTGQPLSYCRVYEEQFQTMRDIVDAVNEYYFFHRDEDLPKLSFGELLKTTKLNDSTARHYLNILAGMKQLITSKDKGKTFKVVWSTPKIILQQKVYALNHRVMKQPLYIFPFSYLTDILNKVKPTYPEE